MLPSIINTIRVHEYGNTDVLKYEQIKCPQPSNDEVLVRVHVAAVLPIDWKIRQGYLQKFNPMNFPYTPGTSFSGVVVAIGKTVKGIKVGQMVFGRSSNGAYTEYLTIKECDIVLMPKGLTFEEAVTISGGAATAWHALITECGLKKGHKVLIHGAAGGVGQFAVQLAKLGGAEVIGTASTKNLEFVKSLGANSVIDYTQTQFEKVVDKVDIVLDTIGGDTLDRSWSIVKAGGTIVSIVAFPNAEIAKQLNITAIKPNQVPTNEVFSKIAKLIAQKELTANISKSFRLNEVAEAHKLSQTGHGNGRIILKIHE